MQFDDQFSGNIDLAWGCLVGEEGDGADMTLPNHSRRPAKMKEQVVQNQNGPQKEKIVGKI